MKNNRDPLTMHTRCNYLVFKSVRDIALIVVSLILVISANELLGAPAPITIDEIRSQADPKDQLLKFDIDELEKIEGRLRLLEAAKAPAAMMERFKQECAKLREKIDSRIAARKDSSADSTETANKESVESKKPAIAAIDNSVSEQFSKTADALAARASQDNRPALAHLEMLRREILSIKRWEDRRMRGDPREAERLVARIESLIVEKESAVAKLAAKERLVPETTLDASSLELVNKEISVSFPTRISEVWGDFEETKSKFQKIRPNFRESIIYKVCVNYRGSRKEDGNRRTGEDFNVPAPILRLPSGEEIKHLNLNDFGQELLSKFPAIGVNGATRLANKPVSSSGVWVAFAFTVPRDVLIESCALIVKDVGSNQSGIVNLRYNDKKKIPAAARGAGLGARNEVGRVWDELIRRISVSGLMVNQDVRVGFAEVVALGDQFIEVYDGWRVLDDRLQVQRLEKLKSIYRDLGVPAISTGSEADAAIFRSATSRLMTELWDASRIRILYQKKVAFIISSKKAAFASLARGMLATVEEDGAATAAYKKIVSDWIDVNKKEFDLLNHDREPTRTEADQLEALYMERPLKLPTLAPEEQLAVTDLLSYKSERVRQIPGNSLFPGRSANPIGTGAPNEAPFEISAPAATARLTVGVEPMVYRLDDISNPSIYGSSGKKMYQPTEVDIPPLLVGGLKFESNAMGAIFKDVSLMISATGAVNIDEHGDVVSAEVVIGGARSGFADRAHILIKLDPATSDSAKIALETLLSGYKFAPAFKEGQFVGCRLAFIFDEYSAKVPSVLNKSGEPSRRPN